LHESDALPRLVELAGSLSGPSGLHRAWFRSWLASPSQAESVNQLRFDLNRYLNKQLQFVGEHPAFYVAAGASLNRESLRALRDAEAVCHLLEILGPAGDAREWRAELRSNRKHISQLLGIAAQGSDAGKIRRQFRAGQEF